MSMSTRQKILKILKCSDSKKTDTAELDDMIFEHSGGPYPIDRERYQDRFWSVLRKAGYDTYGLQESKDVSPHFYVKPYWWGDDDSEEAKLPNFECKELGLVIHWYKYALRGACSNIPFTDELMEKLEDMVK